jgi:hypothetical protein
LHWDPPTTTQLRPPHPALVCFLAATLHSPLLLPHTSSPSPNFLRDLLFAPNCSRSVLSGECQALRLNCGEGLLKRGCAWRLRRVRSPPPRTTTCVRPVHLQRNKHSSSSCNPFCNPNLLHPTVATTFTSHSQWRTGQMRAGGHWTMNSTSTLETFQNSSNNSSEQGD